MFLSQIENKKHTEPPGNNRKSPWKKVPTTMASSTVQLFPEGVSIYPIPLEHNIFSVTRRLHTPQQFLIFLLLAISQVRKPETYPTSNISLPNSLKSYIYTKDMGHSCRGGPSNKLSSINEVTVAFFFTASPLGHFPVAEFSHLEAAGEALKTSNTYMFGGAEQHAIHPGKLTWHPTKWRFGRWCSFPIGWFLGSSR